MSSAIHTVAQFRLEATYQVQNRHLHHTLVEVRSAVLDNLDSDNFLGLEVLTFDDLAEGSLTQNVQDQIPIPVRSYQLFVFLQQQSLINSLMACFLRAEDIVDV